MPKATIEPRYITATQVCTYISMSRTHLYRLIKSDPTFPKKILFSEGKGLFDRVQLDEWIKSRAGA